VAGAATSRLAALAAVALLAGCGSTSTAERLAHEDRADDAGPYRDLLARLGGLCTQTDEELADRALAVRSYLRGMNIPDSALSVLTDATHLAASRGGRHDCTVDFADAQTGLELTGK
jgi:hypothetical protein